MNRSRLSGWALSLAALWAACLAACLPMGDRLAGSSTEAGNAGGKLTQQDGKPAAFVAVALVAKGYLPDTLDGAGTGLAGTGDAAGSYYRTRTDADGNYEFSEVVPGEYRMLAVEGSTGISADSLVVSPGIDTGLPDGVLKPLGGIRGIAKVVGSNEPVNVWVRPKATLKAPPRADRVDGGFRLDSLPEGEYELVPQCFTCRPLKSGYRIKVKSGRDTVLADTLKVYPEYFFDFPDSGDLDVRSSWLPLEIKGKVNRGQDRDGKPGSIAWDWNGEPLPGSSSVQPDGVSETGILLDTALLRGALQGTLRLILAFPDTNIVREWHIRVDTSGSIWPLTAVSADSAMPVSGPLPHLWKFRVAASLPLAYADLSFWGIAPAAVPNRPALPRWLYLPVDNATDGRLRSADPAGLTFVLVPDARNGGRVFRPRFDERLSDFREIRFLEKADLGFADTLEPSMAAGGLILDRTRGPAIHQRYRVDSLGSVEELLAPLQAPAGLALPAGALESPLLFYRSGAASDGFEWDKPLRDAAKALAVTRAGLAVRLDGSGIAASVSVAGMRDLEALLAPLGLDPSGLPDTAAVPATGALEYVRGSRRGALNAVGSGTRADSLCAALRTWILHNVLEAPVRFPLAAGRPWRFLAFAADTLGLRYTGDTLVAEQAGSAGGLWIREFLSAGSPGRALDSATVEYGLKAGADSLLAFSGAAPAVSRLFGRIDGEAAVFPLTGLAIVEPLLVDGLPALSGNGNTLSGRLGTVVSIHGREVRNPGVWLDGRGIDQGRDGEGRLYTPEGGLERAWHFRAGAGTVTGWDRE